jgi:hypothetical protein
VRRRRLPATDDAVCLGTKITCPALEKKNCSSSLPRFRSCFRYRGRTERPRLQGALSAWTARLGQMRCLTHTCEPCMRASMLLSCHPRLSLPRFQTGAVAAAAYDHTACAQWTHTSCAPVDTHCVCTGGHTPRVHRWTHLCTWNHGHESAVSVCVRHEVTTAGMQGSAR